MALKLVDLLSTLRLKSFSIWKILAIFFALLNLKQLPFVWHLRVINGLLQHLPWFQRLPNPWRSTSNLPIGPSALFRPLILSSRATPLECDYNLHKSNSTYFADFDIARMHLLMCLCRTGIVQTGVDLWEKDEKGAKRLAIMMGGVSMSFRKEIKPGERFEMWTRCLGWDRKWIYTVTHFVRRGVWPKGWVLQGWRNTDKTQTYLEEQQGEGEERGGKGGTGKEEEIRKGTHPAILATGIAKYVAKRGRLTIPPELILQNSGLLPPKPKDHKTPPVSETPAPMEEDALPTIGVPMTDITSDNAASVIDDALNDKKAAKREVEGEGEDGEWTWEKVERERLRGLEIVEKWNATEGLSEWFEGEREVALGRYWDIP